MKRLILTVLFFFALGLNLARAVADLPSAQKPADQWQENVNVGVPGGIIAARASYTMYVNAYTGELGAGGTYGGTLATRDGTTDDAPAIQAMLTSCPNGKYVYCPGSGYRLESTLAVVGQTIFYDGNQYVRSVGIVGTYYPGGPMTFNYYGGGNVISFDPYGQYGSETMAIASGNTRGSTSLVLTGLSTTCKMPLSGAPLTVLVRRVTSEAYAGFPAGALTQANGQGHTYATSQLVNVTAINTGTNTITFNPALNEGYASDDVVIGINMPYRCFLENLGIETKVDTGSHTIRFFCANQCWATNVHSKMTGRHHFSLYTTMYSEIRKCIAESGWDHQSDKSYGFIPYSRSCNNLIEDNIGINLRHCTIVEYGGQGNVFGYNYSHDPIGGDEDYVTEDMSLHGGMPKWTLFEGGVTSKITFDRAVGASDHNTAFRNQVKRKTANPVALVAAFASDIQQWNYHAFLWGNAYEAPASGYNPVQYGDRRWDSNQDNPTADTEAFDTASLHGEYILLGGFDNATTSTTWDMSYANSLPNSFYRGTSATAPSWWDGGPYPSIGVDLIDHYGENPAFRRYFNTLVPSGPTVSVGTVNVTGTVQKVP